MLHKIFPERFIKAGEPAAAWHGRGPAEGPIAGCWGRLLGTELGSGVQGELLPCLASSSLGLSKVLWKINSKSITLLDGMFFKESRWLEMTSIYSALQKLGGFPL